MRARRKSRAQLTPSELRIMQVLWSAGPSNVQTVQDGLGGELAYTTVQTVLNVLERKGRVARTLVGRAYVYRPLETQEKTLGSAVHDLVGRMFGGSVEGLLMNLMKTRQLDAGRLAELARRVAKEEEKGHADSK
ncbi:MAG TPA: BlaI/MecI/CopY family transcriptional regulator [Acidisarcina sp.]